MENFQLYRTNLLLGGQLKWDIVIENDNNKLYVNNFNITPISNNIPYTYKYNENILNNRHNENIKLFFKDIEGYFYNEGLDPQFNNNWPNIVKEGEYTDIYSNIYDMGCKRSKNYKRYNKQFEFFCPVWIEKLSESLMFKITIKGNTSQSVLASHTICITNENGHKLHDKFVKYFNNHIKYVGLDKGNDNVLNIRFKNKSYITGLNVKNGFKQIKDISSVVDNMVSRERPVMENDNLLMGCFYNNNIICNQLFNFNLCFNIDDIMSSTTAKLLKGKPLIISVDVIIDGKEIEKRDFNCNYDFIKKTKCYDDTFNLSTDTLNIYKEKYKDLFNDINVFDHLHDNNYLDFANINKYCKKICHWCLNDNSEYMFNIYRGFDGYSIVSENDKNIPSLIEHEHQYGLTPDITSTSHSWILNNSGWINCENIIYWNQIYNYIINTEYYKTLKPTYLNNQVFVNGLRYKYVPDNIYILGVKTTYKLFNTISRTYINELDWLNDNLALMVKDNLILLITSDWNYLTFANIRKILYELNENNWTKTINDKTVKPIRDEYIKYIKDVFKMMQSVEAPPVIVLGNSLKWEYAPGPSKDVKEVLYLKDTTPDYVFRYDGNIKPCFIKEPDIIYYKDYISDNRENDMSKLQKSNYYTYLITNYEPIYSSIDYNACKYVKDYNIENLPIVKTSEHGDTLLINTYEYSWFNNGRSIFVLPELKFTYVNKKQSDNTYKSVKDIISELLGNYYSATGNLLDFIVGLYEYKSNWEYFSDTNVDDYLYTIELTLK